MEENLRCTMGLIVFGVLILIPVLYYNYDQKSTSLGKEAAADGAVRTFVIYLPVLAFISLYVGLPDNIRSVISLIIRFIFVIISCGSIVVFYRSRRSIGNILLNLGYNPQQAGTIILGIYFLYRLADDLEKYYQQRYDLSVVVDDLFYITGAAVLLLIGFSKILITDRGIFRGGNFVRWADVLSYRWEGKKDNKLVV